MYSRIMFPVDLGRQDRQVRALQIAADIAGLYGATVIYTAVAPREPTPVARHPSELRRKLADFARTQGKMREISTDYHAVFARDPASELNNLLTKAAADLGADLIVIGSHFRGRWSQMSHSRRVAGTSDASVLVVRSKARE